MEENSNQKLARHSFWYRVRDLYVDGFRRMTVGRKLWALIIIKLVVIFLVLKVFFFPDFLASRSDTDEGKANIVRECLTNY